MTGSKRWFNYTSDAGVSYAINNDESKGEATAAPGGVLLGPLVTGAVTVPRGIRPRYVNAFSTVNPLRRARLKVGTLAVFNAITSGTVITEAAGDGSTADTWRVTSKRGEQAVLPFTGDTGLLDGDT